MDAVMQRLAAFLLFAFLAAGAPAEPVAQISVHPALWQVQGRNGTATLLGSIHIMPANLNWLTPEIAAAADHADVFVLEVPIDAASVGAMNALVQRRGTLPPGQSLRRLLPPESQADFDRTLTRLQIPQGALDDKRPWLAALMIDVTAIKQQMQQAERGADFVMAETAQRRNKPVRYLETLEQQFALIAPDDPAEELQMLEAELKSADTEADDIGAITAAWGQGDVAALDAITRKEFAGRPAALDAFFTARNKAWAKKIAGMLDEHKRFFIVVGAGHLAGPEGVPALLRAKGIKVVGP
jgi:uncharacterized protein